MSLVSSSPPRLFPLHANRVASEPFAHVQLVVVVHYVVRSLGRCTHHVPFAFISRLAQVLARLGELVRVMLETFRWQSPVFLNAVRRDETRFQCIEQRRARRGHGCEKKSVLTAVASTPPCLSPRSCARHRAWPPSPVAPCSPSPAATRPNSSTACSQTTSRATHPTARSCTPRCDLVQLAPGPD